MYIYNINKNKIEYKRTIFEDNLTHFVSSLDNIKLKELGYLKIDNSNQEYNTNYYYYDKVLSVYNDTCIIKYYKNEYSLSQVKKKFYNVIMKEHEIGDNPDLIKTMNNKKTLIDNCNTIQDLKDIESQIFN